MTDYTKLVAALRYCAESGDFKCGKDCPMHTEYPNCLTKMDTDAADAIEALQEEADKYKTAWAVERENRLGIEEPKRGHWEPVPDPEGRPYKYVCSNCHRFHVNEDEWYGYCPNCGAVMGVPIMDGPIITPCLGCSDYDGYGGCKSKGGCARKKMEVQDG